MGNPFEPVDLQIPEPASIESPSTGLVFRGFFSTTAVVLGGFYLLVLSAATYEWFSAGEHYADNPRMLAAVRSSYLETGVVAFVSLLFAIGVFAFVKKSVSTTLLCTLGAGTFLYAWILGWV